MITHPPHPISLPGGPWTSPNGPHSAPDSPLPGVPGPPMRVAQGCPPLPALGHSAVHSHTAQSRRARRRGVPSGNLGRWLGRGTSRDSSSYRIHEDSVWGLIIPWSQVRVPAGAPPLFFIALWHWDKGTAHCPESLGGWGAWKLI
jgi:hypothetical protein